MFVALPQKEGLRLCMATCKVQSLKVARAEMWKWERSENERTAPLQGDLQPDLKNATFPMLARVRRQAERCCGSLHYQGTYQPIRPRGKIS